MSAYCLKSLYGISGNYVLSMRFNIKMTQMIFERWDLHQTLICISMLRK